MFDSAREVTLEGTVTRFDWANPHVYVELAVENEGGETEIWLVEGQPPSILRRLGWSVEALRTGDLVTVTGRPLGTSSRKLILGLSLMAADGTRFDMDFNLPKLRDTGEPAEERARDISGAWLTVLTPAARAFILRPTTWSLTDAGALALEQFDQFVAHPAAECVPFTAPFVMVLPDLKTIEIGDDAVMIRSEFDGVQRIVQMNESSHEGADPSLQGHSIGHWEDDVLVVDTSAFTEHRVGNAFGLPSGLRKRLVERFELAPDGRSLTYRLALTDPDYLAEPVVDEYTWVYRPGIEYEAVPCDIDSARRYLGE